MLQNKPSRKQIANLFFVFLLVIGLTLIIASKKVNACDETGPCWETQGCVHGFCNPNEFYCAQACGLQLMCLTENGTCVGDPQTIGWYCTCSVCTDSGWCPN
jgi:hypothetical protein